MSHGRPSERGPMPGKPLVFPSDAERDPTPLFRPIPEANCMTGEIWTGMSFSAQAAYRNRNEWLWEFVRALNPGAGGDLKNELMDALMKSRELYLHRQSFGPICAACGNRCALTGCPEDDPT